MGGSLRWVAWFVFACATPAEGPLQPDEVANLRAFARLHGVLRFFHPSDEAAALDWNRYAVLGVGRVRAARDARELEAALEALVAPIAPTVRVLGPTDADPPALAPASTDGLVAVAWQHLGPGFDGGSAPYTSKRTGRHGVSVAASAGWTSVARGIDAAPHRGKPFRLRAFVRAGANARVSAWARVDRVGGGRGFFENLRDRMVTSPAWTEVVVEGTVDQDAERLVFGGLVTGRGEAWLDDFALVVDGRPIELANAGFELGTEGWAGGIGRGEQGVRGYVTAVVPEGHGGGSALRVAPVHAVVRDDLFEERPAPGEVVEVDLGGGLRARVPISVWSGPEGRTLPAGDPGALGPALDAVTPGLDHADARIADVVVAWSVLDQFYPYFDVVGVDWSAALDDALRDALDDAGPADHEDTLGRLVAAVGDGHGSVTVPGVRESSLPLRLRWVEGRLVVVASGVPEVVRGDVLREIDEVPAVEALEAEVALVSGSPQWRRERALDRVGRGDPSAPVSLRLERGHVGVEVEVARGARPEMPHAHPPITELDGGIWYVDLDRAEPAGIEARMAELAAAPGVVFDLRGYPNGTHGVLQHLLRAPERARWMHVARITRPSLPGAPRPAHAWDGLGWDLEPASPSITGRVVFLTGPGAISYAESVMGYVEALGLDVVGAPTAGTNGNVRRVDLPSGSTMTFTGMRVTRHDGAPSHGVGIRPTVPVEPTLAGVRAGRDEVLERALALIRGTPGAIPLVEVP